MTPFEKIGMIEDEAILAEGEKSNEETSKTPEQLRREGEIRALALQAQNRFSAAVEKYEESFDEELPIGEGWKGERVPMLGTFLHICRETLDGLDLRDISENDVVSVTSRETAGNRVGVSAGHDAEEAMDVALKGHRVYSVIQGGEYATEVSAESKDIPEALRTIQDRTFDRLAFEHALSELLAERGK